MRGQKIGMRGLGDNPGFRPEKAVFFQTLTPYSSPYGKFPESLASAKCAAGGRTSHWETESCPVKASWMGTIPENRIAPH